MVLSDNDDDDDFDLSRQSSTVAVKAIEGVRCFDTFQTHLRRQVMISHASATALKLPLWLILLPFAGAACDSTGQLHPPTMQRLRQLRALPSNRAIASGGCGSLLKQTLRG